jgi:histidinol dehydrogenase
VKVIDCRKGIDPFELDRIVAPPRADSGTDRAVAAIVDDVRRRGDAALFEYTRRFDGVDIDAASVRLSGDRLARSASRANAGLVGILGKAAANIRFFHEKQFQDSWEVDAGEGIVLGQKVTPLECVGVYIPGGTAAYPSSVLMNVIPALVAGVGRIVAVTPPRSLEENPLVAAALDLLGIREVYRVGGAQAVAALAYGTESIPRVDKIVGPGNQYVQSAKKIVFGQVNIDMVAGPSEVAIVADKTCRPEWIAADLLAQAEHDALARLWLVSLSDSLVDAVEREVAAQLDSLERRAIARESMARSVAFLVSDPGEAAGIVNRIAPEHAEVLMAEPALVADSIRNAGAVFVGRHSPTAIGDYFAGPNHVLPTAGTARFFSPLGVYDFQKKTSIVRYSERGVGRSGEMIAKLATAEGLTGHARSITIRLH